MRFTTILFLLIAVTATAQVPSDPQWQDVTAVSNAQGIIVDRSVLIVYSENTIYQSTDDGISWNTVYSTGESLTNYNSVDSDGTIYIAVQVGYGNAFGAIANDLIYSIDTGRTWTTSTGAEWKGSFPVVWSLGHLTFMSDVGGYASPNEIMETTDHGKTWNVIFNLMSILNERRFIGATVRADSGIMMLANDGAGPYATFLSFDTGKHWVGNETSDSADIVSRYDSRGTLWTMMGNYAPTVSSSTDNGSTWQVRRQFDSPAYQDYFFLDNFDDLWVYSEETYDTAPYYTVSFDHGVTWDSVPALRGNPYFFTGESAVSSKGTVFLINSGDLNESGGMEPGKLYRSTRFHFLPSAVGEYEQKKSEFYIKPNPASTEITIDGLDSTIKDNVITVYDMLGRTVTAQQVQTIDGSIRLSIAALSAGWYALRIGNREVKLFLKK